MGTLRSTTDLTGHTVHEVQLGAPVRLTADLGFVSYGLDGTPLTEPHWYAWDDSALPTGTATLDGDTVVIVLDEAL
jgi:YD repeat-containing protein